MLYWILQTIILSIIFIVLLHNLIILLKTNLTVPKVKDLVNSNSQKYENIYNVINKNQNISKDNSLEEYTINELLPKTDNTDSTMKNELKNFLKNQLNNSNYDNNNHDNTINAGTDISTLDSFGTNAYADF